MATMNVSLPYSSGYVRDLIRKHQERDDKIAAMQRFVDEGLKSGIGSRSKDDLFGAARARVESPRGN
ncbi:antitoxin [Rhizobium esperanzae]|uniref:Antitoxin n=1 Tax=Rhizobium esperanzae TaxID=1967781 RepID=A0A246E235_9HYPH|nr:type II toxin-antitoxin system ParD family antitoxin [Rhizobium esperanzae]OWO97091.1 antitoxin [Rhizobium esperanzae]